MTHARARMRSTCAGLMMRRLMPTHVNARRRLVFCRRPSEIELGCGGIIVVAGGPFQSVGEVPHIGSRNS